LARFRTTTILRPLTDLLFITWLRSSHKPPPSPPAQSQTVYGQEFSGNLGDAGGFYYRRTALALRKPGSLILVRVDTAKLFAVGIKDADEVVVMFAATIFAEGCLALNSSLCHVSHPITRGYLQHYRREASTPQVPDMIVSRTLLHSENASGEAVACWRNKRNAAAENLARCSNKRARMRVSRR
jgi:hypothetical protein